MSYAIGFAFFKKKHDFYLDFFSYFSNASDIALIQLPSPVQFSEYIQPVPLACNSRKGMQTIVIGNGVSTIFGAPSNLQYVELQITSINQYELFSNGIQLKSVASGDSGNSWLLFCYLVFDCLILNEFFFRWSTCCRRYRCISWCCKQCWTWNSRLYACCWFFGLD